MFAAQALVGVAAQAVAEAEDRVTLPQLRVLMLIAGHGRMNLNALAGAMDVHPSNASRACDRLVLAGYLSRTESTIDRRNLLLQLTPAGQRLVDELIEQRRTTITQVLDRMPEGRRRTLVGAMKSFGEAAGEVPAQAAWRLGWRS